MDQGQECGSYSEYEKFGTWQTYRWGTPGVNGLKRVGARPAGCGNCQLLDPQTGTWAAQFVFEPFLLGSNPLAPAACY